MVDRIPAHPCDGMLVFGRDEWQPMAALA